MNSGHRERLVLLDLLKVLLTITIVIFHTWEEIVFRDSPSAHPTSTLYPVYSYVLGHVFNYGGLFLAAVSFFLFGRRDSPISLRKLLFAILGVAALQFSISVGVAEEGFQFSWDVFSFIVLALLLCQVGLRRWSFDGPLVLLSVVALSIPHRVSFDLLSGIVPDSLLSVVVADFSKPNEPNGWFLFPWIFIPLGFYSLGRLSRRYQPHVSRFASNPAFVLSLTSASLAFYFMKSGPVPVKLGPGFNEFLFWQSPMHFWHHMSAFILFLGVALDERVNGWLSRSLLAKTANLQWVRNLWLCYLSHFMLLSIAQSEFQMRLESGREIDFAWIPIYLGTEVIVLLIWLGWRLRNRPENEKPTTGAVGS